MAKVAQDKEYLLENLAMLLSSGMDVLQALQSMKQEMRSPRMKKAMQKLQLDIEGGGTFWKSLENTKLFPLSVIALVRIGEEAGQLTDNLQVIVTQQQKERMFKAQVRSAMTYPVIVLVLTLVVALGIAWFVLPRLAEVFVSFDTPLPLITRILIAIGAFFSAHGLIAVPLILAGTAAMGYMLFMNTRTRFMGQALLLHTPVIKRLLQEIEIARFGFILGTLLEAGVPVVNALMSLKDTATFNSYRNMVQHLHDSVEDGQSLQKSFASYKKINKLIPSPIQQMMVAGEKSGNLPDALLRIGRRYDDKVDITTKNLSVLLEPIMLVIVWIGVLVVALAVIIPIYGLLGSLK